MIDEVKFKIGDIAYIASHTSDETWETCPDCHGAKKLKVTLGDGSEVGVDCSLCDVGGWSGPKGSIQIHKLTPKVETITITGVNVTQREDSILVEYRNHYSTISADRVFATREDAYEQAVKNVAKHDLEEAERLKRKERNEKTWAWNVRYHRAEIREAEKRIAYHSKKLEYARPHVKEEKLSA